MNTKSIAATKASNRKLGRFGSLWFLMGTIACGGYPIGGRSIEQDRPCESDLGCVGDRICIRGLCVEKQSPRPLIDNRNGDDSVEKTPRDTPDETKSDAEEDCIGQHATCGCEGRGYSDGVAQFSFFRCNGRGGLSLTSDGQWVLAAEGQICTARAKPCEISGLARLLDEAFPGCPGTAPACSTVDELAIYACTSISDACTLHRFEGDLCGAEAIQRTIDSVVARMREPGVASCEGRTNGDPVPPVGF